jgi:hypothetical protein
MFTLQEINEMEQEMCSYLEWQLNVNPATLCMCPGPIPAFTSRVALTAALSKDVPIIPSPSIQTNPVTPLLRLLVCLPYVYDRTALPLLPDYFQHVPLSRSLAVIVLTHRN